METITLLDGRMLPVADIRLDADGWNFTRISSGERLTYKIRQSDKTYYFPAYDVTFGNDQISKDRRGQELTAPLETNTTKILAKQLVTDPLAAPADFAAGAVAQLKKIASSPVTLVIGALLVAGLVIYFVPKSK
jgi:hypothetical protein